MIGSERPCLWICRVTKIVTTAAAAPARRSSYSNAMATPRERGVGGTCKVQPLPDRPTDSSSFPNFRTQHMSKIGPEVDSCREKSSCLLGSSSFFLETDWLAGWKWTFLRNCSWVEMKLTATSTNQPITRTSREGKVGSDKWKYLYTCEFVFSFHYFFLHLFSPGLVPVHGNV